MNNLDVLNDIFLKRRLVMKKNIIVLAIVFGLLLLQAKEVCAFSASDSGTIADGEVGYEFSNCIITSKKSGNAKTHTTSQYAGATANATFYWADYDLEHFGSSYKHFSNYGYAEVYADSLENTEKYYYKVVSYHVASYYHNEYHASYSNTLTTYCP